MDINRDKNGVTKVMTHRSGKFIFQPGIDIQELQPTLDRVRDAHERFTGIPTVPDVVSKLVDIVLVSSIHGTDTIEGGGMSEDEIKRILGSDLENVREQREQRIVNLKKAYEFVDSLSENFSIKSKSNEFTPIYLLKEKSIKEIHKITTDKLVMSNNVPGKYRDNSKGFSTRVGNLEHGGVYVPPKCLADVTALMKEFTIWANSECICSLDPLIRAPLIHYYFESIHPFWDGNGRVGRLLEVLVLKCSGFEYAPYMLSKLYQEHVDEYFSVFNNTHNLVKKKDVAPNNAFVLFFLQKMLGVLNRLHNTANELIGFILYEARVGKLLGRKEINQRQYFLVTSLLNEDVGNYIELRELKSRQWFKNNYSNVSKRTERRDMKKLDGLDLIELGPDNTVRILMPTRSRY